MNNPASFQLDDYIFNNILLRFEKELPKDINIDIVPSGVFNVDNSLFDLTFEFVAFGIDREKPFIKINCIGSFVFQNIKTINEIPEYFYRNAMALLFPYLRAFISVLTLQANIPPLVLPTYNLSQLEKPLRENTTTN
ncbi:protein-export chaperone SecB [Flavobacterium sp. N1719]|uniref:protein-export chaperone SecB n=1 Tax=Flavobacterium sp. N1719 TaxID=2885633 RepID=UPI002222B7CA|nr:protein-export chaperone SecB [Flavobacterium sp. N1719]